MIIHETYNNAASSTTFFCIRNTAKIRKIQSQSDAEKLVRPFVTLRLDWISLQLIRSAAEIIFLFASLHWLPVNSHIEFILEGLGPSSGT